MTAQPTERDQERAAEVEEMTDCPVCGVNGYAHRRDDCRGKLYAESYAALERERAMAPFLALAEELGSEFSIVASGQIAGRIRAAASEDHR